MQKNFSYLHANKIIYGRLPVNDKPTHVFPWGWFYEDGTHEYYSLFAGNSKITSYKSLKWHLIVLWYLNDIEEEEFLKLAEYICDKENNFVSFSPNDYKLSQLIDDVLVTDLEEAPRNKLRKIIFKANSGLTPSEKLSITGTLIGRSKKITEHDIYEVMIMLNEDRKKITTAKIAKELKVSTRTVFRAINDELIKEKNVLNRQLYEVL